MISEVTREKNRLRAKQWRIDNAERFKESKKQWHLNNLEKMQTYKKKWHTLKTYGITEEQWKIMFAKQGFCCAICKTPQPTKIGWCTDHCHETKIVRGILCQPCNMALGGLRDSIENLNEAINYLAPFNYNKNAGNAEFL